MLWEARFELLPSKTTLVVPSRIQVPQLELNELPKELNYTFLGDNNTLPVKISSTLDSNKE